MSRRLDVLLALDYYAPYVSGLTNVARDVAEGLVERGHRVRVIAAWHDRRLPEREVIAGVEVERAPVLARFGKAVVSPALVRRVVAAARGASVTNLHLPMPEAGAIAPFVRSPLVVTYHCDVSPPPGAVGRLESAGVDLSSRVALRRAGSVVVTSDDYARASRVWPAMAGRTAVVPPPCHERRPGEPRFRDGAGLHVGFLGRIVEEKGLQHLVRGFQLLDDPEARLVIGGDFAEVAGGSVVDQVRRAVDGDPRIQLLGFLSEEQIADLYASIDVFALPSVNAFEAFGIVQVEAMMAGVPALASDLPGVRVPVRETGFGVVVPPRDPAAIADGLRRLAAKPPDAEAGRRAARERYAAPTVIDAYEELLVSAAASGR
ncbi:glycosyltransferase family 4 protein [Petropleomorpha daqingensis]|uniref:Glycosyltransferase involved in cell wall biosynthesis n=1 Tax=Petropleomorpha daqingensis TaxID=2026353 RepID=A0A853CC82_9ACTN|nr:glycosyltransferase family 4 protein [Petropleomorpha daqingensis]NYJ04646.1 glycosyltransferase involved in cell wall biosynthesis [Petropleomorpha daqingensis]